MTGVAEAGNDEQSDQGQMAGEKEGSGMDTGFPEVPNDESKLKSVDEEQATVETISKEGRIAAAIVELNKFNYGF